MSAHFQIIQTDKNDWHARRVVNGRVVWWTESYKRRGSAEKAIKSLIVDIIGAWDLEKPEVELRSVNGDRYAPKDVWIDGLQVSQRIVYFPLGG